MIRTIRTIRATFLPLLLTGTLTLPALAQAAPQDHLALGKMWTFENPPLAYLEKEYGFKPDQQWLDSLRLGALRIGERENPWCSASFVSPRGLIMTNHHCVREQVAQIQGENDWVKDGFAATQLEDEVKIPDLTVQQLIAQEDVTAKVGDGIAATDDSETVAKKREANIEKIKTEADAAHPDCLHQVVTLYQGASFQLYRYRVYDDIRLVLAVNLMAAHFGGDPDNFTFPRWSIDFSFVRAYADDKPADTSANYLRWRREGVKENELVFVPGNPGNTNRLMTVAQLECQRDVEYPLILEQLRNGIAIVKPYADRNAGILTTVLSWENSQKAIGGMLDGLRTAELTDLKKQHEKLFQAAVKANPALDAAYGKVWDELAALAARKRELQPKIAFYAPSYSPVIERAVAMAKAFDGTLTEEERQKAREEALGMQMRGNPITEALLLDHFERAAKWLSLKDPYVARVAAAVPTDGPVVWQDSLAAVGKSMLTKGRLVKQMLDAADGAEQFANSDDVGIAVGRVLWPLMQETEKQQKALDAAIGLQGTLIGRAQHEVYGNNVSPDATMTLRFSDGRVLGYEYNGTLAPWATSFYGLYGRSHEFGGVHPFDLAKPWVEAKDRIDMAKKVCFASTNDIVGGNSGSCVVDKDLQVVGLIFDGNIESLPNDFYYTQKKARAVSVHTDAIMEALRKVYDMGRVADELLGK
ncbi:MAG: S46 family peptidase [Planctomycetes bacterium]|nr:S46 family peptidase [Planctomycetota bacterium]